MHAAFGWIKKSIWKLRDVKLLMIWNFCWNQKLESWKKYCNKKNRTVLIETPIHSLSIWQFQAKSENTVIIHQSHAMFVYVCFIISGPCNQTWNWCRTEVWWRLAKCLTRTVQQPLQVMKRPYFTSRICLVHGHVLSPTRFVEAAQLSRRRCQWKMCTKVQKHDSHLTGNKYQGDWTGTFSDWQWCHDIRWCPWS